MIQPWVVEESPRLREVSFTFIGLLLRVRVPSRWIYYPERGDPTPNIPPGTPFAVLLDTWRCPPCKEPNRVFVRIERDQI